jgi:tRNA-splicing ligase RtcB (3'-phosphate/5'-hydroxy nucleic acid ligase)
MTVPIKTWTSGVPFEDGARAQVANLADLPIVSPHIAIMPDVHAGIGCTVGTVVPTRRAIIPACVGVDIGCGMIAARTTLVAGSLPSNLRPLRDAIEIAVPHGGAPKRPEVGAFSEASYLWSHFEPAYKSITDKHPFAESKNASKQLGTLGGGNHFIEVCSEDPGERVWVVLHSGSRGAGNKIGNYFTEKARAAALRLDRHLPDKDLAWLDEGTEDFADYWTALQWAQRYAKANRGIMLTNVLNTMLQTLLPTTGPFGLDAAVVECHHNYVNFEEHFGEQLYVTRKGAVSAREGEYGIIPGSMGAKTFIVRGKGNPESFNSCSHGAGRVMSRGAAHRNISLEQHVADTAGVECSKEVHVLDESPRAYKDIEKVMAAQADLVSVEHTLKQVLCVKG